MVKFLHSENNAECFFFQSARNYARFWITYAKHRQSVALLRTIICARLLRRCHIVKRVSSFNGNFSLKCVKMGALDNLSLS